ncbi:MAG TPA: hypothetical protein PKD00_00440 [Burkholderiales bacterium]|nr:hypothetical protein [Burkholderiales bacterium]
MPKRRKSWTIGQFADLYEKENKVDRATRNLYVKVCKLFLKKVCRDLLNGRLLKIPFMIGMLGIVKRKPSKNKPVDWYNTNKLKRIARHFNLHTDGFCYRLVWYKTKGYGNLNNSEFYSFTPTATLKERIAKKLRDNPNSFFNER